MSRCAGARREHSLAVNPSCPMEILHSTDVMLSLLIGIGWGGRNLHFYFSVSSKSLLSRSLNFSRNSAKFSVSGFHDRCPGLVTNRLLGGEKNCFVHSLFCIFIIITIIVNFSSITIYFTVLLKCLNPNPTKDICPFVDFSSLSRW